MNEKRATIASKALIAHGLLCFVAIGFFTIWGPLNAKLSCKLSHNGKRVRGEIGILKKTSMDSPISKITSIKVTQGILGRMLNYGTISINLSGDASDYVFDYIDNPNDFKNSLMKFME